MDDCKNENITHPLGRKPSPFDSRDYNLRTFIYMEPSVPELIERLWEFPHEPLNQENSGHCVGFSGANWGISSPINTLFSSEDAHRFYYACKVEEGEPGGENGAYVRSIAKVLKDNGYLEVYAFAPDITTIRWWILNRGPIIVGTLWTQDMFVPDADNVIHPTGVDVGGHAYLLTEWRADNYIGIQNSWGNSWGANGKAYISAEDFEKLFMRDGEAIAAVEIEPPEILQVLAKKECPISEFFHKIFKSDKKQL